MNTLFRLLSNALNTAVVTGCSVRVHELNISNCIAVIGIHFVKKSHYTNWMFAHGKYESFDFYRVQPTPTETLANKQITAFQWDILSAFALQQTNINGQCVSPARNPVPRAARVFVFVTRQFFCGGKGGGLAQTRVAGNRPSIAVISAVSSTHPHTTSGCTIDFQCWETRATNIKNACDVV